MTEPQYYAKVERDPNTSGGPGVFHLYKRSESGAYVLVNTWNVLTGGAELNPGASGGLCPPIAWNLVETIAERSHPTTGATIDNGRMIPEGGAKQLYPDRGFSIHEYPFMVRDGDSSTGSIVFQDAAQWAEAKRVLNEVLSPDGSEDNIFEGTNFKIEVVDTPPREQPQWYVRVVRKLETKGPGTMFVYNWGVVAAEFGVITGGDEIDPAQYGGLTPPVSWEMVETIAYRDRPTGSGGLTNARIIPKGSQGSGYSNRTFSIWGWPFMVHGPGRSTGCIAVDGDDWSECQELLNRAFAESTFTIDVVDE